MMPSLQSSSLHSYVVTSSSYEEDLTRALSMSLRDLRDQTHSHHHARPRGTHQQRRDSSSRGTFPSNQRDLEPSEKPVLSSPMDATSSHAASRVEEGRRGSATGAKRDSMHYTCSRRPTLEPVLSAKESSFDHLPPSAFPLGVDGFSGRNENGTQEYEGDTYAPLILGEEEGLASHNSSFSSITGFTYSYPDGSSYYEYQQQHGHHQQLQTFYGVNGAGRIAGSRDNAMGANNGGSSCSRSGSGSSDVVDYNSIPDSTVCSDDEDVFTSDDDEAPDEEADKVDTDEFSVLLGGGSTFSYRSQGSCNAFPPSNAARRTGANWDNRFAAPQSTLGSAFSRGISHRNQLHSQRAQHHRVGRGSSIKDHDDGTVVSETSRGSSYHRQQHPKQYNYRVGAENTESSRDDGTVASEWSAGSSYYRKLHPNEYNYRVVDAPRTSSRAVTTSNKSSGRIRRTASSGSDDSQDVAPTQPIRRTSVSDSSTINILSLWANHSFCSTQRRSVNDAPGQQGRGPFHSGNSSSNILSLWDNHSFCSTQRQKSERNCASNTSIASTTSRSSRYKSTSQPPSQNSGPCSANRATSTWIEISPGVEAPLRGSEETIAAIAQDFYAPLNCIGCDTSIFCIANAEYVLCPVCKCIMPIDMITTGRVAPPGQHGLGLGFSVDDLFRMQSEIMLSTKK